ncbi:MAG: DUF2207 family protein [Peptostreptococcaceae bacterium]
MRLNKKILAFLLLMILSINLYTYKASAEDTGYYIKNMDVNVDVNDKREFKITETIQVYFDEDRHGIIRNIPTSTRLEDYEITDIKVEGAPYTVEENGNIDIRIGDEDETITGDKTYTISYTMKNYNDERTEGDYIYLNVLGDQWDTQIENFTSTITYPQNANLETIKVADGEYGSTESTSVKYTVEKNKIYINSTKTIPAYNAITVNAMLNEGAFKNAPVKQYPYTIQDQLININITEEKQYIIERDFKININRDYNKDNTIVISMLDIINSDSNYYLLDMDIKGDNINFSEEYGEVYLGSEKDDYNFTVKYTIEPRLSDDISFRVVSPYISGKIENLKVSIEAPFHIKYAKVDFNEKGANLGTERFILEKEYTSRVFQTKNTINPGEQITLNIKIDKELFTRPLPPLYNVIKFGAPLFLIILVLVFIKLRDKNQVTSVVGFYPPRHMNSAEVGYAFNESISNSQVTSLLFYFASQGYLKIIMKEKDRFTIEKLKDLDDTHKEYEKRLFDKLFKYGNGKSVTDKKLEGKFINDITKARQSVKKEFEGEKTLRNKKSIKLGLLISILSMLPLVGLSILAKEVDHGYMFEYAILSIILLLIHLVFYFVYYGLFKIRSHKLKKKGNTIGLIVMSILYVIITSLVFIFTDLDIGIILIGVVVSLIGNILSACIPRRSDYGKEILGEILGFRNFIEVAEKERLEALLEEDPEYFYNTLPYAQVLGVTKKWADKFRDITMPQPSYYDTYYPLNNYIAINMLISDMNKVESSATYVEPTTSSDSSSGGGFGGGGFSGGGSGGGGGSSW